MLARPIEVADHQGRTAYDPGPDALMQSEWKTRDCGDDERRGGRETRFHRARRQCDRSWPPWLKFAGLCRSCLDRTVQVARHVDLVEAPVEIGNGMGCHLDAC